MYATHALERRTFRGVRAVESSPPRTVVVVAAPRSTPHSPTPCFAPRSRALAPARRRAERAFARAFVARARAFSPSRRRPKRRRRFQTSAPSTPRRSTSTPWTRSLASRAASTRSRACDAPNSRIGSRTSGRNGRGRTRCSEPCIASSAATPTRARRSAINLKRVWRFWEASTAIWS